MAGRTTGAHRNVTGVPKRHRRPAMGPSANVIVRSAGPGEAATLAELNGVVQQVHHEALPTLFKAPDPSGVIPFFVEQLARPEVVAFVAEMGSRAVGYAFAEEMRRDDNALTAAGSALYVHHVAVRPEVRERGIGRALMSAIDAEARQRGVTELRLDYWLFNHRAKSFFAALGFEPFIERVRRPVPPGSAVASKS